MALLRINNVTKKFGSLIALDDINVAVDSGEVFGFIGRRFVYPPL